jgi:hypothetical protein
MPAIASVRTLLMEQPQRRAVALLALQFVAIGLLAIGVSGALAAGTRALWGDRFLAGDFGGQTYTAARCEDLREYAPSAATCRDAAAIHHTDEVIVGRIAAGVLGIGVLGLWVLLRRRGQHAALPAALVPAIGVTAFGLAAAMCAVFAFNCLRVDARASGAGQWLTAGLVSGVLALWFGSRLADALVREFTSPVGTGVCVDVRP